MKKFKKILWQNLVKIILLTSLVGSCAGIPSNNVKLEDYPQIEQNKLDKITLSAEFYPSKNIIKEKEEVFIYSLKGLNSKKTESNQCLAKVYSKKNNKSRNKTYFSDILVIFYGAICQLSLTIIPCYRQHIYQAQATLIHYPLEFSLRDKSINVNPKQVDFSNNKIQIKQTKKGNYLLTEDKQRINEGDYFLDEDNNLAKLLKTYELKDKVHEYWSLIALLGEIFVAVIHPSTIKNSNISTPERAKIDTENNISEALVRSILNDAKSFPECQKNDDGKDRDQKNLSNK